MFVIYSEKEIFEDIILYKDQYLNWYNTLCWHADVCLNLTDDELENEKIEGTLIFEFIKAKGGTGKSLNALKPFFDEIYDDYSQIAEKPRSVFLLKCTKEKADSLQSDFGVMVLCRENIDDSVLRGTYYKDLPKGMIIENQKGTGWNGLITFPLPPSNTLVLTDDYLFKNEENGKNIGEINLVELLDVFLPSVLKTEYHIAVFTNDDGKTEVWCESLVNRLKTAIVSLRTYPIVFEVVFTKTIHKRKMVLNYLNTTCDKGYSVFKTDDKKTIKDDNDFRADRVFNRIDPNEGDTDFGSAENTIMQLKRKSQDVIEFITQSGAIENRRILGDCNSNHTLRNRLINDI
jgi:hypothetical protein